MNDGVKVALWSICLLGALMVYPPDLVMQEIHDYAQSVGVKLTVPPHARAE